MFCLPAPVERLQLPHCPGQRCNRLHLGTVKKSAPKFLALFSGNPFALFLCISFSRLLFRLRGLSRACALARLHNFMATKTARCKC